MHDNKRVTYSMSKSLEAFGCRENSWQLSTLKPYPSHGRPFISMDRISICSWPVFSILNDLLRVRLGSLGLLSEDSKQIVSHVLRAQRLQLNQMTGLYRVQIV